MTTSTYPVGAAPAWGAWPTTYPGAPPQQTTSVTINNAHMGNMQVDELRLSIHNSNPYDPTVPDLSKTGTYTTDINSLKAVATDQNIDDAMNWYMRYSDTSDQHFQFRQDGQVQINGKMKMLGIKIPFQMDLKPTVDANHNVNIDITKAKAFGFLPLPRFYARDLMYQQMQKADPGDSSAPLITPYGNNDYLMINTHVIYAANANLHKAGSSSIQMDLQHLPAAVNVNLNNITVTKGQLAIQGGNGAPPAQPTPSWAVQGNLADSPASGFFSSLARQGLLPSRN